MISDPYYLFAVSFAGLMLAGLLKGLVGIGYTTCALPILVQAMDLTTAISVTVIPALYSSVALSVRSPVIRQVLSDYFLLYAGIVLGVGISMVAISDLSNSNATQLLGVLTVLYAVIAIAKPGMRLSDDTAQRWRLPVGLCNGVITGASGSQIFPLMPYLASIKMDPEEFVQATNVAVIIGSISMLVALLGGGLMPLSTALVSVGGIIPATVGVMLGVRVRRHLSMEVFRSAVLWVLMALGLLLLVR